MTFVRSKRPERKGYDIGTILRKRSVEGDVGIEIECEGNKFPKPPGANGTPTPVEMPDSKYWSYVKDGSLRGKDNAEYVLTKPIPFSKVEEAVREIFDTMTKYGTKLDDSNRTSVHVHMNAQRFHLNRLTSFCALYFCVEDILTHWCGPHRVGNLFCMRAKDAPGILTRLKKFIISDASSGLSEGLHYSGLNLHSLTKFGSIEIRTMRGAANPDLIIDWVEILRRIYELSKDYTDPREICARFSMDGPMVFFDHILGDKSAMIRGSVDYTDEQLRDSMYEGIRLAQDICYCRDWSVYVTADAPGPFNRVETSWGPAPSPASVSAAYANYANNDVQTLGDINNYLLQPSPTAVPHWEDYYWINTDAEPQPFIAGVPNAHTVYNNYLDAYYEATVIDAGDTDEEDDHEI
jgi:hypothetical protein